MITYSFKDGSEAIFHNDGSVVMPITMSAAEFYDFMPVAILVYHRNMPQLGCCSPSAPYGDMGGKLAGGKIAKKRGRPTTKSATAKRGRPRKA